MDHDPTPEERAEKLLSAPHVAITGDRAETNINWAIDTAPAKAGCGTPRCRWCRALVEPTDDAHAQPTLYGETEVWHARCFQRMIRASATADSAAS